MLHIVDDEEIIRDSLTWLARSRNIAAIGYESGAAVLGALAHATGIDAEGECLLLDVRMPGTSGVALFNELKTKGLLHRRPVIFLTGHGDVPMAVDMLKNGAFDFFEKPFNDNQLMDRVLEALEVSRAGGAEDAVQSRLAALSAREREVLDLILAGKMNKVIADELGISMRTVEVHRAHIFDKMNVKAPSLQTRIANLSGGNQQKVLLARWLEIAPKVLILDEPTRGVDIYAKSEIYQLVHKLAEQGVAVVVISSELPEVIGICDRVLVMREGAITGELAGAAITQEAIMHLATDTAGMHGTHAGGAEPPAVGTAAVHSSPSSHSF